MRQQVFDTAGGLGRQAFEHVAQVSVGVVPVELGRLHETHDRGSALASAQAAGEQPVRAPDGNRTDLVLDPIVVAWPTISLAIPKSQ